MSAYNGGFVLLPRGDTNSSGGDDGGAITSLVIEPMYINGELVLAGDPLDGIVSYSGSVTGSGSGSGSVGETPDIIIQERSDRPVTSSGADTIEAGYQRLMFDEYTVEGELVIEGSLLIL
jgi:hypothetical protein